MYISAAGAQSQSERLQVVTNNLANVDTPGFKRELAVLRARHAEAIEQGESYAGSRTINDIGGGVYVSETATDFSPGTVRQTGVPTDVAIDGDGFFVVEKDGTPLLTRAGDFHFGVDGRLLTQQGYRVLSNKGEPVTIDPKMPWRMLENGTIEQAGTRTELALVKPQSLGDLVKAGENLFYPLAQVTPVARRSIRGGYLERSAVQPAQEMMELIETSRAFEANVRMIQNQDQMIGSLVNRVLRPS
jgi:flagellar basal-body rod protein FlgF